MKRPILLLSLLLAGFIGQGCGSGSSHSTTQTGSTSSTGTSSTGSSSTGSGSGAASLTVQQRSAVFQAISDKLAAIPAGTSHSAVKQTMMQFLAARPEFVNVVSEDGVNVSANFQDGTGFIFYNDIVTAASPGKFARSSRSRAVTPSGLPKNVQSHVMSALGTWTDNTVEGGPDAVSDIRSWLNDYGYALRDTTPTLDGLKNIDSDGIFYLHTHGGTLNIDAKYGGGKRYVLWTLSEREATREDPSNSNHDQELIDDLKNHNVAYCTEAHYNQLGFLPFPTSATHYCFSAGFITEHHWHFADNSLVFINACLSNSANAQELQTALKAANASVTTGWSGTTDNGVANNAARFVFDRMLGNNVYNPETPNQRPFDYVSVYTQMHSLNLDHSDVTVDGKQEISDFKFLPQNQANADEGGLGLLTPSLAYITINETTDEATLNGLFGADPGERSRTVSIGGKAVTVKDWKTDTILLDLPRSGAGHAGNVVVNVNGLKSNAVPITEWKPKITYTFAGEGSLLYTITLNLHVRADVHLPRYRPGDNPASQGGDIVTGFYEAQDSTGTLIASGTTSLPCGGTDPDGTREWKNTATLLPLIANPPADAILAGRVFHVTGQINATTRQLTLYGLDNNPSFQGVIQNTSGCGSSSTYTGKAFIDKKLLGTDSHGTPAIVLQMDDKFNIPAYIKSGVTDSTDEFGDQQPNPISLRMDSAAPFAAPDSARGEDQNKSRAVRKSAARK